MLFVLTFDNHLRFKHRDVVFWN